MRIPTVKLRHKKTGAMYIVNEIDYANNNLPGMDVRFGAGDYERVGELQGESDPTKQLEAEDARKISETAARAVTAKRESEKVAPNVVTKPVTKTK